MAVIYHSYSPILHSVIANEKPNTTRHQILRMSSTAVDKSKAPIPINLRARALTSQHNDRVTSPALRVGFLAPPHSTDHATIRSPTTPRASMAPTLQIRTERCCAVASKRHRYLLRGEVPSHSFPTIGDSAAGTGAVEKPQTASHYGRI